MKSELVTCCECKWWGRSCGCVPEHRYCLCEAVGSELPDGIGIQNGEPFNAGRIATGPNFGCIHGEKPE